MNDHGTRHHDAGVVDQAVESGLTHGGFDRVTRGGDGGRVRNVELHRHDELWSKLLYPAPVRFLTHAEYDRDDWKDEL